MKVYVLVHDSMYDCCQEISVDVFSTFDQAQQAMDRRVNAFEEEQYSDAASMVCSRNTNSVCYYEDGYYSENHEAWEIFERELITENMTVL